MNRKWFISNNPLRKIYRSLSSIRLLLGITIIIGVLLRLYGLFNDSPYFFNPDERRLIAWGMKFEYLQTKISEWGTFPLIIVKVISVFCDLWGDPNLIDLYVIIRVFSVVLATGSIWLVYLLASQIYDPIAGLYAAIFTTFTVLHIQYSHFFSSDSIFSILILVTFFFLFKTMQYDSLIFYILTGFSVGLATATRVTGVLILLPIGVVCIYNNFNRNIESLKNTDGKKVLQYLIKKPSAVIFDKKLVLLATFFLTTFTILTPDIILNTKSYFFTDGLLWVLLQSSGYIKSQYTLQFEGTTPWFFLSNLFWGAGPFLLIAYIISLFFIVLKRQKFEVLILFFFLLLYCWVSVGARVKFIRYTLPVLPILNIITAGCFLHIQKTSKQFYSANVFYLTYIHITIIGTIGYALAFVNIYSTPDTRILAAEWIEQNIKCANILLENDSAYIPPIKNGGNSNNELSKIDWGYLYKSSPLATNYFIPPTLGIFNTKISRRGGSPYPPPDQIVLSDQQKRQYLKEKINRVDYIILSDRHYSVYKGKKALFPIENEYYIKLFNNKLGFQKIKIFENKPNLFGWTINDDEAELTFRIFDHPTIWVFQRQLFNPRKMTKKASYRWKNKINLLGYYIKQTVIQKGDQIELVLFWGSQRNIESNYTIFLHLRDENDQIVTQNDHQVYDFPTSCWTSLTKIQDKTTLVLPPDIPAGTYQLKVGLYQVETLERLPLTNDVSGENAVTLTEVYVVN